MMFEIEINGNRQGRGEDVVEKEKGRVVSPGATAE